MTWNYPAPPRRIKVLHCHYAVRPITEAENDDEHYDSFGFVNHRAQEIALAPDLPRVRAMETLLHEIFHCLWSIFNRFDTGKDQERCVYRMGIGWATVLKENPRLRAWIDEVSR